MTIKEMMVHLQFHSLTPIQEAVMNHFDQTGHIVGLAPTGTGKTHAYLFPLLANIKRTPNTLEAMIILPTNELVLQVERMLKETDQTVEVRAIYGSLDMEKETHRIKKAAPNILITTPAKLHELFITRFAVQLKDVQYVVLDEADMMFDKDFLSMIDPVFVHLEVDKFLLFSASLTQNMEPFIKKYFGAF